VKTKASNKNKSRLPVGILASLTVLMGVGLTTFLFHSPQAKSSVEDSSNKESLSPIVYPTPSLPPITESPLVQPTITSASTQPTVNPKFRFGNTERAEKLAQQLLYKTPLPLRIERLFITETEDTVETEIVVDDPTWQHATMDTRKNFITPLLNSAWEHYSQSKKPTIVVRNQYRKVANGWLENDYSPPGINFY